MADIKKLRQDPREVMQKDNGEEDEDAINAQEVYGAIDFLGTFITDDIKFSGILSTLGVSRETFRRWMRKVQMPHRNHWWHVIDVAQIIEQEVLAVRKVEKKIAEVKQSQIHIPSFGEIQKEVSLSTTLALRLSDEFGFLVTEEQAIQYAVHQALMAFQEF